jgi:hypothetical protein
MRSDRSGTLACQAADELEDLPCLRTMVRGRKAASRVGEGRHVIPVRHRKPAVPLFIRKADQVLLVHAVSYGQDVVNDRVHLAFLRKR